VEEGIIDTAIVLKNVPFTYPEHDFVDNLFPQLGLVPPYSFNYHKNRDDGKFTGRAFANFYHPHQAKAAVAKLNNYMLHNRQLRVEFKKKLPPEEEQKREQARQLKLQNQQTQTLQPIPDIHPVNLMASDVFDPQIELKIVSRERSTFVPKIGEHPNMTALIKIRSQHE
jgi:RNA recognition motif-containing protein